MDPAARFLRREIQQRLGERLGDVKFEFERILAIGTLDHAAERAAWLAAIRPGAAVELTTMDHVAPFAGIAAQADLLPFAPRSFDLVCSVLGLQWANDLPGVLVQIRRCLKPDGLLLAAIFGERTLYELRDVLTDAEIELTGGASPRVVPMVDLRSAAGLLQRAGFALPVADLETITLTYPTMFHLLQELRSMGETNSLTTRSRRFMRRALLQRAAELYQTRHPAANGRITASFDVITLTGWAPSPSQPQPLKPGSARLSLAATLTDKTAS